MSQAHQCESGVYRPYPSLLCSACRTPKRDQLSTQDLCAELNSRASVAAPPPDDDLISRAAAKAAICYMCAKPDRYKPAEAIEGGQRLFHFHRSDNWNAGQCLAQVIDTIATASPVAAETDILDDERVDKELRRWQDGIRDKMIAMGVPDYKIDGAGCDSGDPLDFTLAEVGQGLAYFIDRLEELRAHPF